MKHYNSNAIVAAATVIALASQTVQAGDNQVTLRLICTSDVHGSFFPYDYIEQRPVAGSMARVCSYVERLREQYGDNVLLLDNGDILQGQPTNYYYNYVEPSQTNIAAQVLNHLRYDACSLGNHDIETGHAVYDKYISELRCPVIGANIIDTTTGQHYLQPYTIIERDGVRIAIISLITQAIPHWLDESLWSGMRFENTLYWARNMVNHIRETRQADAIVGLFHSGWYGGIVTDDFYEDDTERIATLIPGFDLVFFGHDHRPRVQWVGDDMEDRTLCLNPASRAMAVADATLTFGITNGKVVDKHVSGTIIDITSEPVSEEFASHFAPACDSISRYSQRVIGRFEAPMATIDCYFGSAPFVDFVHNVQLQATGADISFCAPLSPKASIEAGPVTMADMFKLYRYENRLCALRMTGREVRQFLEMSYALWTNQMTLPTDHIMLFDPNTASDQQRRGFKNFSFNFDSAAGIIYEVDVTQRRGHKVRILSMADGRPFCEDSTYTVAMNSYRANGGGELITRGAGIDKDDVPQRIVYQSERDLRQCIIESLLSQGSITPTANANWRFVPEEWTKPAIERDKRLIMGAK